MRFDDGPSKNPLANEESFQAYRKSKIQLTPEKQEELLNKYRKRVQEFVQHMANEPVSDRDMAERKKEAIKSKFSRNKKAGSIRLNESNKRFIPSPLNEKMMGYNVSNLYNSLGISTSRANLSRADS
jgi:Fic family protein